jgi:hypothetical protein
MAAAAKKKPAPAQQMALDIQEGVHLNLPDRIYFEVHALGSSDFHVLDRDPPSWWYASPFNPERKEQRRRSRALAFGSALHALILEGERAYEKRFVVEPDGESNRWLRSRTAIVEALEKRGVFLAKADSFDTAKLVAAARKANIAPEVWDVAQADFEAAKKQGKDFITTDEDRRLRRMAHIVSQHPDLGPNLKKGLSEVSVFWREPERPGILLRARFDKLLPGFTLDLKTFANQRDESPEDASLNAIVNLGYDLQAEHYRRAREKLAAFVAEGRYWHWDDQNQKVWRQPLVETEKKALLEIAAAPSWLWVWIFYQVQSDDFGRERGPVVRCWHTEPKGELFDNARGAIERALTNYETWTKREGLDRPWADVGPINPLPLEKLKRLTFKRTAQ